MLKLISLYICNQSVLSDIKYLDELDCETH